MVKRGYAHLRDEMIRLREEGYTHREIARALGVKCNSSVAYWLGPAPVSRRRNAEQVRALKEAVERLARRGLTQKAIAQNLGISQVYAWRLLTEIRAAREAREAESRDAPPPQPQAIDGMTPLQADLLRSGGTWAEIAAIASRHGLGHTRVQQEWHRIRHGV